MATVLVVEDEDVTRLSLETRLHIAGHRVHAAASMEEAQHLMEGVLVPDVVVSDMFMPGGSGLSLVASLRGDPDRADIPVIFLSGRALPGDVAAGTALGATYLDKPVSMADLTAAIEAALDTAAGARGEALRTVAQDLVDLDDEQERELLVRMLGAFLETAPGMATALGEALEAGDPIAVEEGAHKLRGSAATLGAQPLARLCEQLEEAARAGRSPLPAPAVAALTRELTLTCDAFEDLARELSPPVLTGQLTGEG